MRFEARFSHYAQHAAFKDARKAAEAGWAENLLPDEAVCTLASTFQAFYGTAWS